MFAKLLKYEWKATSKVLGILSLAALGAGALGALLLRMLYNNAGDNLTLAIFSGFAMLAVVLALVAYAVATTILLLARFYRNKFTDEGYLTFTLPVSCHQLLLSTIVNMLLWTLISVAVLVVSGGMIILIGTADKGLLNMELLREIGNGLGLLGDIYVELGWNAGHTILSGLNVVLSTLSGIITMLTAITIGAVIAKKHKILAAFGIYYGINIAVSILSATTSTLVSINSWTASNALSTVDITTVFQLILALVMIVGGYLLTTHLMRNKLNLS